jgi:hypothetical protein
VTSFEIQRKFITCDTYDLPIGEGTSHVIWSWAVTDPTSLTSLVQHTQRGAHDLNLLGERQFPIPAPDAVIPFLLPAAPLTEV